MSVQTVKTLSELVNTPVEKLLTQMKEAGLPQSSESQEVSDAEKQVLLKHLSVHMEVTKLMVNHHNVSHCNAKKRLP